MIYHVLKNFIESNINVIFKTTIQFIMFLSRCLNIVEKNYWSTKLEITKIIWVIRKIRHLIEVIEVSFTIIYIDHSTAISILKQIIFNISNTDKLNLRLIQVSQYLLSFNIILRHKFEKSNIVFDVLSRLQDSTNILIHEKKKILKTLYDTTIQLSKKEILISKTLKRMSLHVTLIRLSNEFKKTQKNLHEKLLLKKDLKHA